MRTIAAILATVACLVAAGCSKPAGKPPEVPKPAQQEPPKVGQAFTAKSADGRLEAKVVVAGTVASVELGVKDFTWNSRFASKEPKEPKNGAGEGHAILILNSEEPKYIGSIRSALTGLKPGKHTLKIALVHNDNSPLNVETTIDFEVK